MRLLAASDEWKAVKKSSKEDFRLSFDTDRKRSFATPSAGLNRRPAPKAREKRCTPRFIFTESVIKRNGAEFESVPFFFLLFL